MKRGGNKKEKAGGKREEEAKAPGDGGKSGSESSDRGGHCRVETLNSAAQPPRIHLVFKGTLYATCCQP